MPRRGEFPSPVLMLRQLVFGVSPLAAYTAHSVDLATTRQLNGRGAGGRFKGGEPSSPGWKFSGDLGIQQDFRGGAFVGKNHNLRRSGEDRALPATSPAAGNPVLDALAAVMPTSSGTKRA